MDRATVEVYERSADEYARRRSAFWAERAEALAAALPAGSLRLDLGCGPGLYLPHLGSPVIAADAAHAMVVAARNRHPPALALRCDLLALPLRSGSVAGVWASSAHQHIAAADLPEALGELHRILPVGGRIVLTMFPGVGARTSDSTDEFPGRLFTLWEPAALTDLLVGAGFDIHGVEPTTGERRALIAAATRARTLSDRVAAGMRLLICGLNPSFYSADEGIGYARPGNRFWPAMVAAGLSTVGRDPTHLLERHGIGMTDLVKRATVAAAELRAEEYRSGLARVHRLCGLLAPRAVCFVGLTGWRRAADPRAVAGWQDRRLAGVPVYVMPSTSGLNARTSLARLTEHLREAAGQL